MISEKLLRRELKRYPAFIKKAIENSEYEEALSLHNSMETIQWILDDEDNA